MRLAKQKANRRYAVKMHPERRQTETARSDWTRPPLCLLGLLGGPRMVIIIIINLVLTEKEWLVV